MMRTRFVCLPPWAWLTIIILTECVLLAAWLCREYFVFDYTCFIFHINSDQRGNSPQKIHLLVELPPEQSNQTRIIQERSTNATIHAADVTSMKFPPTNKFKPRESKRPHQGHLYLKRTIESVVRIEPLLSLYSDNNEQVPFKTKTTWNKYHKQAPQHMQHGNRTRKRRKKKRPLEMLRKQDNLASPATTNAASGRTASPHHNSQHSNPTTSPSTNTSTHLNDNQCPTCQDKPEEKLLTVKDQVSRWKVFGVGGSTTLDNPSEGLNFTEQLQTFVSNAICIGRTMADFWSIGQILAALPFLLGLYLRMQCLFTPFLVLSALFLVVMFIYAATLTIFSLVLFMLVVEMSVETLLDWMLFAAVLDAIFVFATLIFALTLQKCESLLTEFQQNQFIQLPSTILVEPNRLEFEAERKKQQAKNLFYPQLAIDNFMNGNSA